MEKVFLVTVNLSNKSTSWSQDELEQELCLLTRSVKSEIVGQMHCSRQRISPSLYIGSGKAQQLRDEVHCTGAQVVIFNNELTPVQQRNLEKILDVKTIDRTQLILDIFARHAKTQEGKIQVELAQLQYLLPRLAGKGVALSRLGGGIGTRGPGEQKLEIDRRRIRKRIDMLKDNIESLKRRRQELRKKRIENSLPTITLVGYTNAGKSTLLNVLTKSQVKAKNEMFSTLDPVTKKLILPGSGQKVIIADTVGFLHNLPHHLIDAFKATLEVVTEADLLLVVLDVSSDLMSQHNDAIWKVLEELNAQNKPMLYVLNKIDLLEDNILLRRIKRQFDGAIEISAKENSNIDMLLKNIEKSLENLTTTIEIFLQHSQIKLLNFIHEHGKVSHLEYQQEGISLEAKLPILIAKKILTEI